MQQHELKSYGCWMLKGQLGSGGFGEVLHWRNRQTQQEIATKRLKDNPLFSTDEIVKLKERWNQEYEWTRNLNNDYIVRGVVLNDDADKGFVAYLNKSHAWQPLPVIIMEYCNAGDLRGLLQRPENVNGLTELEVRDVLRTLRHAIEFLHEKCRIFHRDLKPDNIVIIEKPNGERTYKLTDFGFARRNPEHTCKQSVVGTQHYFAPEIIDTAKYRKNVDYWSLGIIAFELCCGVLPFIPHQSLYEILVNIRRKDDACISITEDLNMVKHYHFNNELLAEQNLSIIFREKITRWLRLALDKNYKTRGGSRASDEVQDATIGKLSPPIFVELDQILQTKVLTAYCLTTFQFLTYEVDENMKLMDLVNPITRDTGLKFEEMYFVLPTGHPHKQVHSETQPINLYVENYTEPVMFYIIGYQCDCNAKQDPLVSDTIRLYLEFDAAKPATSEMLEPWKLQQLILHTHFLLANEQKQLSLFLEGLKEYALILEHEMHEFIIPLEQLTMDMHIMHGQVLQFSSMITHGKDVIEQRLFNGTNFFKSWMIKNNQLKQKFNLIQDSIQTIKTRFESAFRNIKQQANSQLYEEYVAKDIYSLASFRNELLSTKHKRRLDAKSQIEFCKNAIYDCFNKRNEFHCDKSIEKAYDLMRTMHKIFCNIKEAKQNASRELLNVQEKLTLENQIYHAEYFKACQANPINLNELNNSVHALHIDGNTKDAMDNSQMDSLINSFGDIMNVSTNDLIHNALQNVQLMSMDIEESLPSTINQTHANIGTDGGDGGGGSSVF